jgi:hypothetical protein
VHAAGERPGAVASGNLARRAMDAPTDWGRAPRGEMIEMQKRRALAGAGVAVALVLAGGCGKAAEKITEKAIESETGGNVDLDADGGMSFESGDGSFEIDADGNTVIRDAEGNVITADAEGNMTMDGEDGETTYATGENAEVPDGWPAFLALPDGASIMTSQTGTADDVVTGSVMAEVDGDVKDLYEGYKEALEDEGFEIGSDSFTESSDGDFASVTGEKGDESVSITVSSGTGSKTNMIMSVTGL